MNTPPHMATGTQPPANSATAPQALLPLSFPLWGSRLIEASAGTGKTWTIAALYVRLVLGHGEEGTAFNRPLQPADILVMTFTRAATRELSDRIRQRLLQAAQCFRGEQPAPVDDAFLQGLLAHYPDDDQRRRAAWLLANAAEGMDEASVHTIDAWCQRMLKEHAFDSCSLFDEELLADQANLLIEACQDHWRQEVVPLQPDLLEQVLQVWPNVQALHQDMLALNDKGLTDPEGGSLAEQLAHAMADLAARLTALKAGWAERAQDLCTWLDDQIAPKVCPWNRQKLSAKNYRGWLGKLASWANDPAQEQPALTATAWQRLHPSGIMEARTDGAPVALPPGFAELAQLQQALAALPTLAPVVRRHAAVRVAQRMAWLKQQTGQFGFADMQHRLADALAGPNGERLKARIVAQYPVALVDEFQDTSPLQYRIFDGIYDVHRSSINTSLLLIGDPKQSIYGFRGADIHSYMAARQATQGRHHVLDTNHRSTADMVAAVNHCFARAEATQPAGAFGFGSPSGNPVPFNAVRAQGRSQRFVTAHGPEPALLVQHDLALSNADGHRARFAARCAERIVTWLNDPCTGFESSGKDGQATFIRLRPADVAVLVRTGKEALAVRRELARRQVASVYLSEKDSVFDSAEAADVLHWLRAVAAPRDLRLVRAALATRLAGFSLAELMNLAHSEDAFDQACEQMLSLHKVWQSQGVLGMLRQTLHLMGLPARWLQATDGERRLTNFLHLAELLQAASTELDGEHALIRWLGQHLNQHGERSDEQVVRLESDADLVKVITVHKSKGLQFPLVLMPFAWGYREVEKARTRVLELPNESSLPGAPAGENVANAEPAAAPQRQVLLEFTAEQLAQADAERLREDLRLLYVGLTRAQQGVWLGFAAQTKGNSSACTTHRSGIGRLLGGAPDDGDGPDPEGWLRVLQDVAQGAAAHGGQPPLIQLQAAGPDTPVTLLQLRDEPVTLQAPRRYTASFDRRWTVGSFSALTRDLASPASPLAVMQVPRPADDEPNALADVGLPLAAQPAGPQPTAPWHLFPRGALAGNFLHDQLEWLAAERFQWPPTVSQQGMPGDSTHSALVQRLRQRAERAGHALHADGLVQWLQAVVSMPLRGPGVALSGLETLLPEMEFWVPVPDLQVAALDGLCNLHLLAGQPRPPLVARQLHGMLMGFADLVFEHQGRYWVLDYKSNHLGADASAYHRTALQAAMAQHRYDVQAVIYLLALHRLLRQRLGSAYQPEQHLGGAVYLFLRGIDGPEQGVCLLQPPAHMLLALDALLDADGEAT